MVWVARRSVRALRVSVMTTNSFGLLPVRGERCLQDIVPCLLSQ